MIDKVVIKDNKKSPLHYLPDLDAFQNGAEFSFKPGVNVIVGANGCGKTTLLKLICAYLLVGHQQSESKNVEKLFNFKGEFCGGVDVYADYVSNVFRLAHPNEYEGGEQGIGMNSFDNFGALYQMKHASTGEGVNVAINTLFNLMFSPTADLKFPALSGWWLEKFGEYLNYVKDHKRKTAHEITILMDEPDRNLDLENIGNIKNILSFHKEHTQLIAVVHNPLLVCSLAKNPEVNMIEMTEGYVERMRTIIKSMI